MTNPPTKRPPRKRAPRKRPAQTAVSPNGDVPFVAPEGTKSWEDIDAERQKWALDLLFPMGAPIVVAGGPGVSKTTILAFCAAGWSKGQLDGDYLDVPLNVAFLTREDSASKTLVPKLKAADAGRNVVLIDGPLLDNFNLATAEGRQTLKDWIEQSKIQVIVLDSLMSFMDTDRSLHGNYPEAVKAMTPLAQICAQKNVMIVAVMHLTKKSDQAVLDSIIASVGITGTARHVLMVGKTPAGESVIGVVKSNVGVTHVGTVYTVSYVPTHEELDEHGSPTGHLIYGSQVKLERPATAEEVELCLKQPKSPRSEQYVREVLTFMRDSDQERWISGDLFDAMRTANKFTPGYTTFKQVVAQAVTLHYVSERHEGVGGKHVRRLQITTRGRQSIPPPTTEEGEQLELDATEQRLPSGRSRPVTQVD